LENEKYKEDARNSFLRTVEQKADEYNKWLEYEEHFDKYIELVPDTLETIPNVRIWMGGWGNPEIYVAFPYSASRIKLAKEIMEEAGWTTTSEIGASSNVYLYYYHPELTRDFQVTLNIETPKEVQENDGQICVLVPIEWEAKVVATTYDRLCPESHPELFDKETGKYIGDDLFPPMPEKPPKPEDLF
jgi:hypothetical protein